jgi:hypothetical protein
MIPTIQQGQFGRYLASGGATDPFFGNVLILLNGQSTVTKDSSSYDRTLTASADLSSSVTLFDFPTYQIDEASGDQVRIASDSFFNTESSNKEWCLEVWARFGGQGEDERFCSFGQFELRYYSDGKVAATCYDIANNSYTVFSAPSTCTTEVWYHLLFCRDKSDATFDYLKLYVDGTLASTSQSINKPSSLPTSEGFGRLLGYFANGSWGHFSNLRFTVDTAREYGNFTRPSAPFPIE